MKPMIVKMTSATTTNAMCKPYQDHKQQTIVLTAKETISTLPLCHLRKSLTIRHDAQSDIEEELEALQEIGNDASPPSEEAKC